MMKINYACGGKEEGVWIAAAERPFLVQQEEHPPTIFSFLGEESVVMEKWPASRSRARQTRDGEKRDLCGGGGQAKRKIHQRIWDQDAITVYRDQRIGIPFFYLSSLCFGFARCYSFLEV